MLIASHRLRAHEVIHAGCVSPLKCPCCGQDSTGEVAGKQPQHRPLSWPQIIQQTPPPIAQSALQRWPPRLRASTRLAWLRKEEPQASWVASASWTLLCVWERQRLGGQQDLSYGHLWQRGHSAAKRKHQQREQEAVLLRDHMLPRQLQLFGDRCEALELQLHQLAHFCACADFLQKPGGVEAHTHQRGLCVCAEPQVLAAVRMT